MRAGAMVAFTAQAWRLLPLALGMVRLSAGSELGCPFDVQSADLVGGAGRFGFAM